MKITLDEIAHKAGVSRATVDRVLNKRGKVKKSTAEKVHRAAFNTNYFVGMAPSDDGEILYKFDFIFPQLKTGYFSHFVQEITNSELAFSNLNCRVETHLVEDLDPETLSKKLLEVGEDTDGIAFVALDQPIVRDAIEKLAQKNVAVVSLVSDISFSKRIAYVGLDNRAAGRTAAMLMGRFLGDKSEGTVALFPGRPSYRGHEEREAGFKSMMREKFPRFDIVDMPSLQYDSELARTKVIELLQQKQNLVSIYNTAGGTNGIAEALKETHREKDVVFIAHELSDLTRGYLLDNTIDVIINQDIRHEIFIAIEHLIRNKKHETTELSMRQPRLEIYLSENIY